MILNGKEIEKLIKEKNIISNYNLENIHSSSYDITISNKALKFKTLDNEISLFDASKIENLYEEINIDNGYVLSHQESILLSLKENINLPNNILAHIRPRTSFSRLGLLINFQHINPRLLWHSKYFDVQCITKFIQNISKYEYRSISTRNLII